MGVRQPPPNKCNKAEVAKIPECWSWLRQDFEFLRTRIRSHSLFSTVSGVCMVLIKRKKGLTKIWYLVAEMIFGAWTGDGFSNLKKLQTRIRIKIWNLLSRSAVRARECVTGSPLQQKGLQLKLSHKNSEFQTFRPERQRKQLKQKFIYLRNSRKSLHSTLRPNEMLNHRLALEAASCTSLGPEEIPVGELIKQIKNLLTTQHSTKTANVPPTNLCVRRYSLQCATKQDTPLSNVKRFHCKAPDRLVRNCPTVPRRTDRRRNHSVF